MAAHQPLPSSRSGSYATCLLPNSLPHLATPTSVPPHLPLKLLPPAGLPRADFSTACSLSSTISPNQTPPHPFSSDRQKPLRPIQSGLMAGSKRGSSQGQIGKSPLSSLPCRKLLLYFNKDLPAFHLLSLLVILCRESGIHWLRVT